MSSQTTHEEHNQGEPDTTTPATQPPGVVIETSRQNGVVTLRASLDLPPNTLTHLSITSNSTTAEHDVRITQTALSETTPESQPNDVPEQGIPSTNNVSLAAPKPTDEAPAPAASAQDSDTSGRQPARPLLLLVALVLAFLGQRSFQEELAFTWSGAGFFLLAVLAFVAATLDKQRVSVPFLGHIGFDTAAIDTLWSRLAPLLKQHTWRVMAFVASLALTAFHLTVLRQELPDYNWTFLVWLAAIGFFLLAIAPLRRPQLPVQDWRAWWRAHWHTVLLVSVIVLVAFGLRIWRLSTLPETLGGDEASQGIEAMRVLSGDINNPFTTGWLGVPTMSFYFNALTIGPLGNTIFALRLPWVLVGTLTVLVTFFLVRRLYGQPMGLLTAALLATYHYHIHYSRLGSNQVADGLFVALALFFFYRGYDQRRWLDWAFCGLVVGVAQFFYAGARFTAIIVIALIIFFTIRDGIRFWRTRYAEILVLFSAMLISSAPMIQYAMRFPHDYNARVNEVGIIQSGWLEREQEALDSGPLPILFDQFKRAVLAFNAYPDRTVWYGTRDPLLDFTAAALFLLGLGYGTLHMGNRRLFPMVAWWGGAAIMGGMLTESPPSSQRLITLATPTVFFVALALWQMGQVLQRSLGGAGMRRVVPAALSVAVLLISLVSVHRYFVVYTPERIYGSLNGVVSTELGKYARAELGPDWRVYFFGLPRMYAGFSSFPYLAPDVDYVDGHKPLEEPVNLDMVTPDKNAAFIFLPERADDMRLILNEFPGGELQEFPSPHERQPLFTLYRLPREKIPERSR